MFKKVLSAFFSEDIWLPVNTTWKDVHYVDGDVGSNQQDIYFSLFLSLMMLTLRYCAQKFYLVPLGNVLGINNGVLKKVEDIPLLEKAFINNKKYSRQQIEGWSKQLDLSERDVERWMKLRSKQNKHGKLDKFCESCWRFLYYSFIFIFGLSILWNTPWLWNIQECRNDYPNHPKSLSIWFYYMLSLAFYWSLTISQFFDAKRKDFWQMFIHHMATIALLIFSWITRFHRIGTLILLTHDIADIPLEAAKIVRYIGWKKVYNVISVIFIITWFISRIGLFPFWILKGTLTGWPGTQLSPGYYIFNGFLILLMILHIYWTNLILQVIRKTIASGNMESDIRSDSSDSSE